MLRWPLPRIDSTTEGRAAQAAVAGLTRDLGYDRLVSWAAADPGDDFVTALPLARRSWRTCSRCRAVRSLIGRGIAHRFDATTRTSSVLEPERPIGEPTIFRAETIPALANEGELRAVHGRPERDQYEKAICR